MGLSDFSRLYDADIDSRNIGSVVVRVINNVPHNGNQNGDDNSDTKESDCDK
ncbi:hypothetical protein D3C81_2334420 [compost metagenome]